LSSNYKQGISCRVSYVYRATGLKWRDDLNIQIKLQNEQACVTKTRTSFRRPWRTALNTFFHKRYSLCSSWVNGFPPSGITTLHKTSDARATLPQNNRRTLFGRPYQEHNRH
jgi:hypothetical protein